MARRVQRRECEARAPDGVTVAELDRRCEVVVGMLFELGLAVRIVFDLSLAFGGLGFGVGLDAHRLRDQFFQSFPALRNNRIVLFLSRIHQIKGCDLLIEAFAKVAACDPALQLVMAGPDQDGWKQKLMAQAKARGVADRITWTGMLAGDLKWGAFYAAEVFVLPSHSENFGIVVAEALACGLPVLITNKVNIWQEIVQDGAGFAEPDTVSGMVALLEHWIGLSMDEIIQMRRRARACFEARFEINQAAKKLVHVIAQSLLAMEENAKPSGSVAERG